MRKLVLPALLEITLASCSNPAMPADGGIDAIDADVYPTSCDATVPGRTCFDICLYKDRPTAGPCVVFCQPIPPGGRFGNCTSDDRNYVCQLMNGDAGEYVYCLTLT